MQRRQRIVAPDDDELETATRWVDRLARTDPARDQLPGVRHQHEVADDLDRVAIGHDPEPRRFESDQLADRGTDVGAESKAPLPLVFGRGHDPCVEAHPAGDREDPLARTDA